MSRSGYSDDIEDVLAHGRWRGRVASAIRGKRGQALLIKIRDALEAMPVKELHVNELEPAEGEYCTLGALLHHEKHDYQGGFGIERLATQLNVAEPLIAEIVFFNDEYFEYLDPATRWEHMHRWIGENIKGGASNASR